MPTEASGSNTTNIDDEAKRIGLRFRLRNDLIYYTNFDDGRERLYVPEALEHNIFKLAHNEQHHGGFHRTYDRIAASIYIRYLAKHLRVYIEHCPAYQLNQTKRHKPYRRLLPINKPNIPFHTITIDFILALPVTKDGCDSLLTVTCKASKRMLLIAGQSTWDAPAWANATLAALIGHDWGIPQAIISDRDSKFVSAFWKTIFTALKYNLLTSTAYHTQTDEQSERTNQTVKIAIRFYLSQHIDVVDWTIILPYLQGYLNNSPNQSTSLAPNKVIYGFKVRNTLGILSELPDGEDYSKIRQRNRQQAEESVAFANTFAKLRYNAKHKAIDISTGDKVYLRLGHRYNIPGVNPKLHQQRIGPFKVLERVGPLAYRLKLPPLIKIHPVVSIAQLEPLPAGPNPYHRPQNANTPTVIERESEGLGDNEYVVKAILGKRGNNKYLVKWKNYGHKHNV